MIVIHSNHHLDQPTSNFLLPDGTITEEVPERVDELLRGLDGLPGVSLEAPHDHGRAPIEAVHPAHYLDFLASVYAEARITPGFSGPVFPSMFAVRHVRYNSCFLVARKGYYGTDLYSPIFEKTREAAYWSAQTAITASERLLKGNAPVYALCRPPGHHATADTYGGFCFLNNAAIAARYLQSRSPGAKVAILDIDVHHGNGTQEIFYSDPSVLFCSLHGHPDWCYPYYSGMASERGAGAGEGYNHNFPLQLGAGEDRYGEELQRALRIISDFAPQFLAVSAGFDAAAGDPYGGLEITPDGFAAIGSAISTAGIPTLYVQEGGVSPGETGD